MTVAIAPDGRITYAPDRMRDLPVMAPPIVRVFRNRGNHKVGGEWVAITTAGEQASCPKTCPFMGTVCYGENVASAGGGTLFDNVHRSAGWTLPGLVAEAIRRNLSPAVRRKTRVFRANVVGDILTALGRPDWDYIGALRDAATKLATVGVVSWTYTHAWRMGITQDDFGDHMVARASCGSDPDEVREAHAAGWYAAMVVEDDSDPVLGTYIDGRKVVQCPATRAEDDPKYLASCADCRACGQRRNVIAFPVHGAKKGKFATVAR